MRRRRMRLTRGHAVPVTTLPADASTYGPRVLYYKYPVVASLPATVVNDARYVLDATKVEYLGVGGSWVAQSAPTLTLWLYESSAWVRDYFASDMCPMPIEATGTGAGVVPVRMTASVDTVVYSGGACRFYTDASGTLNEAISFRLSANVDTVFYVRLSAGSCLMLCDKMSKITKFGTTFAQHMVEATNAPVLKKFNTKYIPSGVSVIRFYGNLLTISGTTYEWVNATSISFSGSLLTVSGTTFAWDNATLIRFEGSLLTVSGTTYEWVNATSISFSGSLLTVSGTTFAWDNATLISFIGNLLTVSGTTFAWDNATYIRFEGSLLTVSGTTFAWDNATLISFIGNLLTVTYTTKTWRATMSRIHFNTPSITSAMVDQIAIDVSASGTLPIGGKAIYLAGSCGAATAASLPARNDLIAKTFSVTVNT